LVNPNNNETDGQADNDDDSDTSDDVLDLIDEAEMPDIHAAPDITGCISPVCKLKNTTTVVVMNTTPINSRATRNVPVNTWW
jgi:hypothetical protein